MQKRRRTVEDVARAAGVSLMTVSRAISGRPGVSESTRRAILKIAARMDYRPSRVARGLASRKTSTLGIVFPDMANPFFAILAKAASDVARAADLNVFIMNTDEDPAFELSAYDSLVEEHIDGVIVAASRLPRRRLREAVSRFRAPVLVNSDVRGAGIAHVDVDDKAGILDAVGHLLGAGRRRIGLIAGPKESGSARRRLAGFKAGLAREEMRFDPDVVERCIPDIEGGMRATAALVERRPSLDAIIAYNDVTAIGVLRALAIAGRRVPDDVAVIGVDDVPYAALVRPSLTTLRVDISAVGRLAMTVLLALRDGKEIERLPPLKPALIVRESA
jgi:LacI family transcriptional regulator